MNKQRLDEIRARAEAGITVFGPKGTTGKIVHFHQDTRDLLAYVEELEEIEQIYKRSKDDYDRRIAELLDRVDELEKRLASLNKSHPHLLPKGWFLHPDNLPTVGGDNA